MPVYAIGDLQGCQQNLTALLEKIYAEPGDPRFVFVGDLVNRGPQSLETLRTVKNLGESALALLGNHDLHLLAVAHGIRKSHPSDTVQEILDAPDRDTLLDWLRSRPLAHFQDGYLMVHAGVPPQWTCRQTLALAHEVQAVLQGPDWIDFLREMYGNQPARWDDALIGADRLRCIVNALTRIRFCTPDGSMELSTKEAPGASQPGHLPWFELPGRRTEDTTVIFGHWSTLGLVQRPNLIGLDTGCVWGGRLSAVRLEDRAAFQVDCLQYRKPG